MKAPALANDCGTRWIHLPARYDRSAPITAGRFRREDYAR